MAGRLVEPQSIPFVDGRHNQLDHTVSADVYPICNRCHLQLVRYNKPNGLSSVRSHFLTQEDMKTLDWHFNTRTRYQPPHLSPAFHPLLDFSIHCPLPANMLAVHRTDFTIEQGVLYSCGGVAYWGVLVCVLCGTFE